MCRSDQFFVGSVMIREFCSLPLLKIIHAFRRSGWNQNLSGIPPAIIALIALQGCAGPSEAQKNELAAEVDVPSFSAKNGLHLPEATRRALGLKIVEVTEKKVTATV